MAIDRLINSTQGDSIINALGASGSIATSLATIAAKSNTPYNSDNKLNTQYTTLTGYEKASSATAVAASDNVPNALGKLEYKVDTNTTNIETNRTNILSVADQSTQYNIVPIKSTITTGNASVTATVAADKSITIAITGTTSTAVGFEISDNFNVDTNTEYVMTGNPSAGAIRLILQQAESPYNWIGQQYNNQAAAVSPNISLVRYYVYIYANSSGTITIKPMLTPKSLWDKGFTQFQPYALPNTTITPVLQECVDNGVKNYSSITGLSKDTTTAGFASETNFGATIPAGTYVVSYDLTRTDNTKTGVIGFRDVDGVYTDTGYYWTTASYQIQTVTFSKAVKAINMYVAAGTTCTMSNLMIQTIASYNAGCTTYQPYAMSNAELTENVLWNMNRGVKNLAKVTTIAGSYNGFTVSTTNTTVTLESGTQSPAPTSNIIPLTGSIELKAGTYKLTGCPATGSDSTYRMDIRSGVTVWGGDYGAGGDIVITADTNATIYIRCERGFSITTPLTFKPMLCPKPLYDADPTYQPYAMSNAELTAKEQVNENNILLLGEKYIDKFVANTAKTITLASASQYIITINAYAEYGVFLCYKYNNESSTRLYTLSKSSDFDQNITVAAEADSNNISITPASSSVWYVVGGVRLN